MKGHGLPPAQLATVRLLLAAGFTEGAREGGVVVMVRNNDHRLVRLDGSQRRALGAKR